MSSDFNVRGKTTGSIDRTTQQQHNDEVSIRVRRKGSSSSTFGMKGTLVLGVALSATVVTYLFAGQDRPTPTTPVPATQPAHKTEPTTIPKAGPTTTTPATVTEPKKSTTPIQPPTRTVKVPVTKSVSMRGPELCVREQGDWEVDTDDWTEAIVGYSLDVDTNKTTLSATVTYIVKELQGDGRHDGNDTRIRMTKKFELYRVPDNSTSRITRVLPGLTGGPVSDRFRGKSLFSPMSFKDVGALDSIRVTLDGKGGHDQNHISLSGKFDGITVELTEQR
jgi:hypothetical protein